MRNRSQKKGVKNHSLFCITPPAIVAGFYVGSADEERVNKKSAQNEFVEKPPSAREGDHEVVEGVRATIRLVQISFCPQAPSVTYILRFAPLQVCFANIAVTPSSRRKALAKIRFTGDICWL